MSQDHFDKLVNLTESRYLLSKIVGIRAAQLKKGVPSTLTAKAIRSSDNAVSVAMTEVAQGAGIVWGAHLPNDTIIVEPSSRTTSRRSVKPINSVSHVRPNCIRRVPSSRSSTART